ncbi:MAG: DsrE family protein [Chloroflexota bacterium]
MKVGVVIYSGDAETVWNAFRFGNFTLAMKDEVQVFLIGKGVELESLGTEKFNMKEQVQAFINQGGKIWACGTCLKLHELPAPANSSVATLNDLYWLVKESDRLINF